MADLIHNAGPLILTSCLKHHRWFLCILRQSCLFCQIVFPRLVFLVQIIGLDRVGVIHARNIRKIMVLFIIGDFFNVLECGLWWEIVLIILESKIIDEFVCYLCLDVS
jgi:hypothetical protein